MAVSGNKTIVRARELRRSMSLPEGLLWQELRKRPAGFKFRRQHPFGPYVLDFFCASMRLAIEVDGFLMPWGIGPSATLRVTHGWGLKAFGLSASMPRMCLTICRAWSG